ncbi:hypothetical protein [Streptomyces sp. NPDC059761]|uniref:hypothetical protein n=1 Tax=Streptomyces sp. NPDC059761 TaxID=3346937 RepID=UPI003664ABBB
MERFRQVEALLGLGDPLGCLTLLGPLMQEHDGQEGRAERHQRLERERRGHGRHVDGIGTDHGTGALWPGRHGDPMDGFEFGACEGDTAWLNWVCSWA